MASPRVGNTAVGAAVCRLIEQYQPPAARLFTDPVIGAMLSAPVPFLMRFKAMRAFTVKQTEGVLPGLYGEQVCRTRAIDEALLAALAAPSGPRQVVILGAGFDTRAYRLPPLASRPVFEVDLPSVQQDKQKKVHKFLGRAPEHVTFVPIDFDTHTLGQALAATPFDAARPAVFIWEAVTQYLSEAAVRQTLDFVGHSAPGSVLIFTYVLKAIIERHSGFPGADKLMDFTARGAPFIFGLEPAEVPAFIRPYHLQLLADVGPEYYQEHYLKPIGRKLEVSEIERVVTAQVVAG